ncbi:GMP synthase [glutamine-hydrolyzing] [Phycisphaerae bacterium RAS1]|nr:GMP synthase [glutamine-hydrolyzing] [Phycisphaerae bacterium RAS1]
MSDSARQNTPECVAILDFGSQYAQLIARRVRENHVYSELLAPDVAAAELRSRGLKGIILSGGPASVYSRDAPRCDPALFELGVPVLGICYGMQLACQALGGSVTAGQEREYGRVRLRVATPGGLFAHVPAETFVWMSHGDVVTHVGGSFESIAATDNCPIAAVRHRSRPVFGVQFHPEVSHTPLGGQILRNFLYEVCGCRADWSVGNVIESSVAEIRAQVAPEARVICGLSGGVDSSVAATLLHRAIGERLVCIFVDNGLLRRREAELVESTFRDHFGMQLRVVDAAARFLTELRGVVDPQEKRRIIGHEFIAVFKDEAARIPGARYLAQGTIYPDVIESGHGPHGQAVAIKSHHNVGGLPEELGFELVEPLRHLFKDEVRRLGEALGIPEDLLWRHPFPGPGLAVRIAGDITPERLEILRSADEILLDELITAGWYKKVAQGFAVLAPVASVGVMGDDRTFEGQNLVVIRLVETTDFMTADWVRIDHEVLARVSSRIINEVRGVNRVAYDISSKPPSTIEWQ